MLLGRTPKENEEIVSKIRSLRVWARRYMVSTLGAFVILTIFSIWVVRTYQAAPLSPSRSSDKPEQPKGSENPSWYSGVFRVQAGQSSGTAFLVTPTHAITNAHVVGSQSEVTLYTNNNKTGFKGRVIWRGSNSPTADDVAVIEVPSQNRSQVLPLGNSEIVNPPEKVVVIGYELGDEGYAIREGTISSIVITERLFKVAAPVNMGDSGGPVISSRQNAVVGVVVAERDGIVQVGGKQRVIEQVNYAIQIKVVEQLTSAHLR